MLEQKTLDWLRLALIPEIGPVRGRRLLERFAEPGRILAAPAEEIASVVGGSVAQRIDRQRKEIKLNEQLRLVEEHRVKILAQDDPEYPANLKNIFDPPLVLFVRGQILPQDYFSIAVVGTRLASFYGRTMACKLSSQLAEKGFTIVSGAARGIDTFSHQAALGAKGRSIAVLGCGLDIAYPPENKKLIEEIAGKGALISEFPLSTRPARQNFPMRNRIISGLSLGVLVIEAPQKSGALITVTHAAEQGREVFSVPGKADSFTSKGTNQLLRDGAKLVENADDIIEELEPLLKAKIKELKPNQPEPEKKQQILSQLQLSETESKLYGLLSSTALDFDNILVKSQLPVSVAQASLTTLELKRLVKQLPGKVFTKINGSH
ncbi:MAG: DNA-processing protein DprA [Candidatus Omnitrophota bacterium]